MLKNLLQISQTFWTALLTVTAGHSGYFATGIMYTEMAKCAQVYANKERSALLAL
jgi:hypothetical protein